MKILDVLDLKLSGVKTIRYGRFADHRGFFAEHFRKSDFMANSQLNFLNDVEFFQCNESYSKPGTIRGLHFQWNPFMGKLIRTLRGRMIDLALDIRKSSPTFGKIIGHDMPAGPNEEYGEWIWLPPGFAHGNYFTEETHIEYFCSGEWSPSCETGISPFAEDIDWSLCEPGLKSIFDAIAASRPLMTEKDRNGHSLASWISNPDSDRFIFESRQR
jgi:dTDP-4-dehydrorhamnose 3,5-epimerase